MDTTAPTLSPMLLDTDKMRARREELELSQGDAAERAGMNGRQQWNLIESGRRPMVSLATLEKIGLALLIQPRELVKEIRLPAAPTSSTKKAEPKKRDRK